MKKTLITYFNGLFAPPLEYNLVVIAIFIFLFSMSLPVKSEIIELADLISENENERTITGTVKDDQGEPLPGVSVLLKGSSFGVATDIDGKFQLKIPIQEKPVLVFSFVGMKTREIVLGKSNKLEVELESMTQTMDEIIIVAYGAVKKASFTGSASMLKGDQIMKESSPISAEKSLQGYVAGVRVTQTDGQPGAKATVQIRGIGSINGNIEPLYVIDGVPMVTGDKSQLISSNVMSALNPNDIESMTILKDAAATSLYGSRAANGVVIITTKQGKAGQTVFNVDYEHGWTTTAMPHELFGLYMNGEEYTRYALEGLSNRYLYDKKALPGQENYDPANTAQYDEALDYAYKNLRLKGKVIHPDDPLDGTFDYENADKSAYLNRPRNTDWAKELFNKGSEDKLNISAKGGNEKLRFFTSLGYMKQVGLLPSSKFERITGKVNLENKVTKSLSFALNQTLSQTDQSGTSSGGYYSNPIWGLKSLNPTAPIYLKEEEFYRYPGFVQKIPNYVKNVKEQVRKSTNFRTITNLTITWNLLKWLTFRSVNGLDYMYLTERSFSGIDSHDGRNERGDVTDYLTKIYDLTTSNTLSFNHTIGAHTLAVLGGYEAKNYKNRYFGAEGSGFISDDYLSLDNAAVPVAAGGSHSHDRLISYLVKVDYNYDNKYYLSGSFRRDASSRLAKEKRWGNFFAGSLAWTLSREEFMKSIAWLDNLRLKVSYGTTGNLPSSYYESQSLYSLSNKYNGSPVFFLDNIGNADLTWEHSYTWNIGFDFMILNQRLNGSVEYYNKLTDNLLNYSAISNNTGFSSMLVNEGELKNKGVELTLSSQNIQNGDGFNWSTDFNISYMQAKVHKLAQDDIGSNQIYREGEDLYSFYLREWAGVNEQTGEPLWYVNQYEEDGKTPIRDGSTTSDISKANRIIIGKAYPDYFGGLTNRFSYKGLEVSFLLTFTLGGKMESSLERTTESDGRYLGTYCPTKAAVKGIWQKPGDKASKPLNIFNNPYNTSERSSRFIHSTDHIRLKNITIAYSLSKHWMKRLHIDNMKIYANATDIYTWYKYDYINPEVSYSGSTNAGSRYPALKSWRIGINLQF